MPPIKKCIENKKRMIHPLQFVNSQRLPVSPPENLPIWRRRIIPQAPVNRNDIMSQRPWIRPDSQLSEEPTMKLPVMRKIAKKKPAADGTLRKFVHVRRRRNLDIDNLSQKNMLEGSSSAEDISPSKFEETTCLRKSGPPKKRLKFMHPAGAAGVVGENVPVVHVDDNPPVVPRSPLITPDKSVHGEPTNNPKGPCTPDNSRENESPSRSYTCGDAMLLTTESFQKSMHLQDGNFNEPNQHVDSQQSNLLAGEIDDAAVMMVTVELTKEQPKRTPMMLYGTPITTNRQILVEDSPDYQSGRVTCSLEGGHDLDFSDLSPDV